MAGLGKTESCSPKSSSPTGAGCGAAPALLEEARRDRGDRARALCPLRLLRVRRDVHEGMAGRGLAGSTWPGIRSADQPSLEAGGVETLAPAGCPSEPVDSLPPERLDGSSRRPAAGRGTELTEEQCRHPSDHRTTEDTHLGPGLRAAARSPTRATSSWISRATRSGGPTSGCSSSSVSSPAPRGQLGRTGRSGPTTEDEEAQATARADRLS